MHSQEIKCFQNIIPVFFFNALWRFYGDAFGVLLAERKRGTWCPVALGLARTRKNVKTTKENGISSRVTSPFFPVKFCGTSSANFLIRCSITAKFGIKSVRWDMLVFFSLHQVLLLLLAPGSSRPGTNPEVHIWRNHISSPPPKKDDIFLLPWYALRSPVPSRAEAAWTLVNSAVQLSPFSPSRVLWRTLSTAYFLSLNLNGYYSCLSLNCV